MYLKTLEVAGLYPALRALRLPFGRECRSVLVNGSYNLEERGSFEEGFRSFEAHQRIDVCEKDLELAGKLEKAGDCEAKALRGIIAWVELKAPVYWWCELETYRAGHERLCSESTMHIDCAGLSGEELVKAKQEIPMGKELTKVDYFSYQALRNIYIWRHAHRLPEWHWFCDWIKSLPLANELILAGLDLEK